MSSCGLAGLSVADPLQPTPNPLQIRCNAGRLSREEPAEVNANRFAALAGGRMSLAAPRRLFALGLLKPSAWSQPALVGRKYSARQPTPCGVRQQTRGPILLWEWHTKQSSQGANRILAYRALCVRGPAIRARTYTATAQPPSAAVAARGSDAGIIIRVSGVRVPPPAHRESRLSRRDSRFSGHCSRPRRAWGVSVGVSKCAPNAS